MRCEGMSRLRELMLTGCWLGMLASLGLTGCGRQGEKVTLREWRGEAMGTTWMLKGWVPTIGRAEVEAEVRSLLEDWESATSVWRADSELAQFNAAPADEWVCVGPRLWKALRLAREIGVETEGALDVTLEPLVRLWGFGKDGRRTQAPDAGEVSEALARCGWRHLEWDETRQRLKKLRPGMEVNVNCVVEGLAMDEVAARLRQLGWRDFLFELGGEVLAAGENAGGPWKVGLRMPGGEDEAGMKAVFSVLAVSDAAVATSGTDRQWFGASGKRFHHVLDPRTGRPVEHALAAVSVMDESCGRADGFATALLVLGPERGRPLAERLGLRVFWIEERE